MSKQFSGRLHDCATLPQLARVCFNQRESQSFARKPVDPFLKFTLTHLARQKSEPRLGVGRWPIVACEFKWAGFLEGETIGTSLLIAPRTCDKRAAVV
ncbi:hypothetical protein [Limnobacter thiooxidans]|uniref:hypothetical protein n=1 Tax=Limnobacter thiooxidans TaxID=131080 RepID=UPI00102E0957